MKTIGIIGGMSWESTIEYYRYINEEVSRRVGGLHSAKIWLESYDFDLIEKLQTQENWEELGRIMVTSAQKLEQAGADYIAIATNTMHLLAPQVQANISIPLIHIAEATANTAKAQGINTVALFGTRYTMTKPFYKDKLQSDYHIQVILPQQADQTVINDIIYNELCRGIIKDTSRERLEQIINECQTRGAQAVVLGCTELPLIIKTASIPVIDTTKAHSLEIVNRILQ
ncbi:MAG: aspartate/glutamate racemase family protein [Elusimicrobiaceae bacterium]|nr:aspartate/glutamate racemase family protein [Elusimicrobiaceae bacterium]